MGFAVQGDTYKTGCSNVLVGYYLLKEWCASMTLCAAGRCWDNLLAPGRLHSSGQMRLLSWRVHSEVSSLLPGCISPYQWLSEEGRKRWKPSLEYTSHAATLNLIPHFKHTSSRLCKWMWEWGEREKERERERDRKRERDCSHLKPSTVFFHKCVKFSFHMSVSRAPCRPYTDRSLRQSLWLR